MHVDLTLIGQGQNLTSGQGHVVTLIGHVAYQSMRLGERNSLGPTPLLYLYSIKSDRQKTHLTSYDSELPGGEAMGSKPNMGHREWTDTR